MKKIRLAIFASGEGTNAQSFIDYFKNSKDVRISLIVCNNQKAGVIERAKKAGIETIITDKENFYKSDALLKILKETVDFIVLAGFLWMVPENIINAYSNKIVNIHPALLPKYGGKGMYGMRVHQAVIDSGAQESGITIHYVNNKYDEGTIIFQSKCSVSSSDTAETLAKKVHELEYQYYPEIVDKLLHKIIS